MRAVVIPKQALEALRPFLIELRKVGFSPRRLLLLDLGDIDDPGRVPPHDLQGELLRAVVEAWHGRFGERAITAAEALRVSRKDMATEARRLDLALRGVVLVLGRPLTPQMFGHWLRKHKQIECNGKAFFAIGDRDHTRTWGVRVLRA